MRAQQRKVGHRLELTRVGGYGDVPPAACALVAGIGHTVRVWRRVSNSKRVSIPSDLRRRWRFVEDLHVLDDGVGGDPQASRRGAGALPVGEPSDVIARDVLLNRRFSGSPIRIGQNGQQAHVA